MQCQHLHREKVDCMTTLVIKSDILSHNQQLNFLVSSLRGYDNVSLLFDLLFIFTILQSSVLERVRG